VTIGGKVLAFMAFDVLSLQVEESGFGNCIQSLTTWSRVLLEKLMVTHLVKKFPVFYGTRRFITIFTRDRHWSLS